MATMVNGIRINSSHMRVHELVGKWSKNAGFCWASNDQIAKKLNLSKSYVSHIITDLHRAGMLARKLTFDVNTHEFQFRQISACKKPKRDTAEADAELDATLEKRRNNGVKSRLIRNGSAVAIAPLRIIQAILKYGDKAVDKALAIVRASTSVTNPYAYFYRALENNWTAGKRAAKLIGQEFTGGRRQLIKSVSPKSADVVASAAVNNLTAQEQRNNIERNFVDHAIERAENQKIDKGRREIQDPYLRKMWAKRTGKTYIETR